MVERDRFVFLSVYVDDLLALGDGGQRLVDDLDRLQRLRGCVQLAQSAVDQDQAGHFLLFFLNALVAAGDDFPHGGKVVDSGYRLE